MQPNKKIFDFDEYEYMYKSLIYMEIMILDVIENGSANNYCNIFIY